MIKRIATTVISIIAVFFLFEPAPAQMSDAKSQSEEQKFIEEALAKGDSFLKGLGKWRDRHLAPEFFEFALLGTKTGYAHKTYKRTLHKGRPVYTTMMRNVMYRPDGVCEEMDYSAVFDSRLTGISFSMTIRRTRNGRSSVTKIEGKQDGGTITFTTVENGKPGAGISSSMKTDGPVIFANYEILILRQLDLSKPDVYGFRMFSPDTGTLTYHFVEVKEGGGVTYVTPGMPPVNIKTGRGNNWEQADTLGGMIAIKPIGIGDLEKGLPPDIAKLVQAIQKHIKR